MMKLTFVGDISKDFNVIRGQTHEEPGGGVFHNSMTAAALGATPTAITTCAAQDRRLTDKMTAVGVNVVFCQSGTSTTTIENIYPDENPDSRRSRLINGANPFKLEDFDALDTDIVHVNPLWYPLFSLSILEVLRKKVAILSADAQGFLRNVSEDGKMYLKVPAGLEDALRLLDVLKLDISEAGAMTGLTDIHAAAVRARQMGPKIILLTHSSGVCVHDGAAFYDHPFEPYPMEGRTGRGDTCSAAFLYAMAADMPVPQATEFAAGITSKKLQYPGPYRG